MALDKWDPTPNPEWDDRLTALGALVVSGAHLEETVKMLAQNLLSGPNWRRTGILVEALGAGAARETCERLAYQVLAGSLLDDVVSWLRRVAEVQRERNAIIHARWAHHGDIGMSASTTRLGPPKRGVVSEIHEWTGQEIDQVARRCSGVYVEGMDLVVEVQQFSLRERRSSGQDLAPWTRAGDVV